MPDEYHLQKDAHDVSRRVGTLARSRFATRLFRGDPSLWSAARPARRLIRNRLGWLRSPERMLREVPRLEAFAREAREDGIRRVVLLGMGGSSLCVEVFRRLFPRPKGFPEIVVLDSTVPGAVRRVEARLEPASTLFIVSSKSGTTGETAALQAHFWATARRSRGRLASRHFVAITDPGTPLSEEAAGRGYRATFHNAADVGGRFSALSYFGLVPAALIGVDIADVLRRAIAMLERCGPEAPVHENPGLVLGATLGALARRGRDKLVLRIDAGLRPYELWIEQLIAESSGKNGRGLVPVSASPLDGRPVAPLGGPDRVIVSVSLETSRAAGAAGPRGTPEIVLKLRDRNDIGASMVQWEIATSVACAAIGVNPFDEPNVAESKAMTEAALRELDATGRLGEEPALVAEGNSRLFLGGVRAPAQGRGLTAKAIRALLRLRRRRDYVALLAYVDPGDGPLQAALGRIVRRLASATGLAVTLGYGPRYLHSTGQLHKGGPNRGLFIQIVPEDRRHLAIPGRPYDFETLKQAQSLGDYRALKRRARRIVRLRFPGDARPAVRALERSVSAALGIGR